MHDKYCLPIIKHHKREIFDEIEHNFKHYAYFEVWLDYIENVDDVFVNQLIDKYPHKIVLLFRRERLDDIVMPFDSRFQLLQSLNRTPSLIDFDIKSQLAEFEYVKVNGLRLHIIGSYHNYKGTPDIAELEMITGEISAHDPEIIKISTYCHTEDDAIRLLRLQMQLKHQKKKHIVLGMGPHGAATRIFGSIWGNELIFAPVSSHEHTAQGQFTRHQLEVVFKILEA